MPLTAWAVRHHVSMEALAELQRMLTVDTYVPPRASDGSEASVQALVRLEASQKGDRLWRNNVGAGKLENGSYLRWGLANDSPAMNALIKSADLIGIHRRCVTQADVGTVIGQFMSREVKHAAWRYAGTPREVAQLKWIEVITALGGDAAFATAPGTLPE